MGYDLKDLQPSCLYITISVPALPHYQSLPPDFYLPYLLDDFDPTKYETSTAAAAGREEFDWGLYWLHDHHQGTLYTLRRTLDHDGSIFHSLVTVLVPPSSLRLSTSTVGLVRVLSLPPALGGEIPAYLDWLTAHAAPAATRTFIWAATSYMRCRKHVAHMHAGGEGCGPEGARPFDINLFLKEALAFAYGEVWYGIIGGQLPRPVMVSEFGVELQPIEEGEGGEVRGDDAEAAATCDTRQRPEFVLEAKTPLSGPWMRMEL